MITVQTHQARKNLAQLIEQVFYNNERVLILRNKRPMAWMVGDKYMKAIEQMVDILAEEHPEIARKLAGELEEIVE